MIRYTFFVLTVLGRPHCKLLPSPLPVTCLRQMPKNVTVIHMNQAFPVYGPSCWQCAVEKLLRR